MSPPPEEQRPGGEFKPYFFPVYDSLYRSLRKPKARGINIPSKYSFNQALKHYVK